jgi:hypothetical protein
MRQFTVCIGSSVNSSFHIWVVIKVCKILDGSPNSWYTSRIDYGLNEKLVT